MTSVVRRRDQDDSGEYSDASQDIENSNSLNDGQQESDYDSQGSDSERSEGDAENQETERRVDDDEDRSNPQYIPKRGTFYEHDDRTASTGEESANTTSETASEKKEGSETPAERRRPPRKSDIVNKWSHDKYIENEQIPKTRDELVSIYGYDIRNEEAPPHARRNRRYGRGPNKYTRTWEDEEAYRRQNAAAQPRKPPNPEDFPELEAANKKPGRKPRVQRPRSKSQPNSNDSVDGSPQLRRNASIKTTRPKPQAKPAPVKSTPPKNNVPKPQDKKLPALENLTITTNLNNSQGQGQRKVSSGVAQQRPVPTDQQRKKPNNQTPPQNNSAPSKPAQPEQTAQQKPQPQQNQQQQSTGTEGRGGSKRYSSLRQRPLGDSYTPQQPQQPAQPQTQQQQQPQQQHRYHAGSNEYGNGNTPAQPPANTAQQMPQHPQHIIHPVHRNTPANHGPSPPHQNLPQTHAQQVRLGLLEQQQLVSHPHHTIHNIPQPHTIGQLQPAQGYAPPAMMPAQYMQQSGTGPVYGGGAMFAPPPPPAPYTHQMYPHHNYATQAGGVTYYNCAEQEQQQPPPRAQRRPTAAIPIVRPQQPERPANSSENDNIDRIVENMFVRKPWQGTHGADKEKSIESRGSQEPASKESSQPNSLTSSSISIDSKPSESKEEKAEEVKKEKESDPPLESITDA